MKPIQHCLEGIIFQDICGGKYAGEATCVFRWLVFWVKFKKVHASILSVCTLTHVCLNKDLCKTEVLFSTAGQS